MNDSCVLWVVVPAKSGSFSSGLGLYDDCDEAGETLYGTSRVTLFRTKREAVMAAKKSSWNGARVEPVRIVMR